MRRSYDKQFKIAAVELVLDDDMPVAEAAKALNIHYNSLYRWISEYEEYGESAFPGHGTALYSCVTNTTRSMGGSGNLIALSGK